MRYLRMLTNSVLAGTLGAAFVTLLVLQLNPHLELQARDVVALGARLWLFYGAGLTAAFYGALLFWQLFAREPLSPGWLSVRLLAWMSAIVTASAAGLMWVNLWGYQAVLGADAARRFAAGAAATTMSAVLVLTIAVVHYSFGRRGSWVGGTLYALAATASLLLPLTARGWGTPGAPYAGARDVRGSVSPRETTGRVVLMVLDGASLDYVTGATTEGRLPNLGRLLDRGSAMLLETVRPTQPAPVWTAVATGKYPVKNGVRSAAAYAFGGRDRVALLPDWCLAFTMARYGFLDEERHRASALRARTVWDILGQAGITVGVTGWPLTDPVVDVEGFLVTDRYPQAPGASPPLEDRDIGFPAAAVAQARRLSLPADGPENGASSWLEAVPHPRDEWMRTLSTALEAQMHPRFVVTRFVGLDVAGHYFLRFANPRAFGDVTQDERRRFGRVLDQHYEYVDVEIGRMLAELQDEDLLLVVSGFGMDPVGAGKRLLAQFTGGADLVGTHERGPAGFLLAYGAHVAGGRLPLGAVVDVAPTVLYFFGLPLARDMDGYPRTDIFDSQFRGEHPVTFIPSYER